MEIKKINKKLEFDVEAQVPNYGTDCLYDCWQCYYIFPRANANDWYCHENGWLSDCDCYYYKNYQWGPQKSTWR